MAYYDIEEIEDLKKEVLSLKHELNAVRDELNKARLALAQIYEIVDHEYNWEYDYGIGEIYGKDLEELAHIIKEYGV
jgi:hypothetical protein